MTRWSARSARTGRFVKRASVAKRSYRRAVREGKRTPAAKVYTVVQAVSRAVIPGTRPKKGEAYVGRRYVEALERKVYAGRLSKKQRERLRIEARDRLTDEVHRQLGRGGTTKVTAHVISGIDVTTRVYKRRPKDIGTVVDVRDSKQRPKAKYKGRMQHD